MTLPTAEARAASRYRPTAGTGTGGYWSMCAVRARAQQQTGCRSDGRTPDRYIDAQRWKRACSVNDNTFNQAKIWSTPFHFISWVHS